MCNVFVIQKTSLCYRHIHKYVIKCKYDKGFQGEDEKIMAEEKHGMVKESLDSEALQRKVMEIVSQHEATSWVFEIQEIVKEYEEHVRLAKHFYQAQETLMQYTNSIENDAVVSALRFVEEPYEMRQETFFEELKVIYWSRILRTESFSRNLTNSGREKLDHQVEEGKKLEITSENILLMLSGFIQNSKKLLLETCVEMFDMMTSYHLNEYSKNVHYYSGWQTNDAFKINKKIIIPFRFASYASFDEDRNGEYPYKNVHPSIRARIEDFNKVFAFIKPNFDKEFQALGVGEFENEVFRFKIFKKGTVHIWFKDLELLEQFNLICGQEKNWVPDHNEIRRNPEARKFVAKTFPKNKQLNRIV